MKLGMKTKETVFNQHLKNKWFFDPQNCKNSALALLFQASWFSVIIPKGKTQEILKKFYQVFLVSNLNLNSKYIVGLQLKSVIFCDQWSW